MNRRGFLSACAASLASLPVVGGLFAQDAEPSASSSTSDWDGELSKWDAATYTIGFDGCDEEFEIWQRGEDLHALFGGRRMKRKQCPGGWVLFVEECGSRLAAIKLRASGENEVMLSFCSVVNLNTAKGYWGGYITPDVSSHNLMCSQE